MYVARVRAEAQAEAQLLRLAGVGGSLRIPGGEFELQRAAGAGDGDAPGVSGGAAAGGRRHDAEQAGGIDEEELPVVDRVEQDFAVIGAERTGRVGDQAGEIEVMRPGSRERSGWNDARERGEPAADAGSKFLLDGIRKQRSGRIGDALQIGEIELGVRSGAELHVEQFERGTEQRTVPDGAGLQSPDANGSVVDQRGRRGAGEARAEGGVGQHAGGSGSVQRNIRDGGGGDDIELRFAGAQTAADGSEYAEAGELSRLLERKREIADSIHREEWNGPGAGDRSGHGRSAADQAGEMAEPGLGGRRDAIDRADQRGQPAL